MTIAEAIQVLEAMQNAAIAKGLFGNVAAVDKVTEAINTLKSSIK